MSDRNGTTGEEWLTIGEAARRLDLSERQTRRLVNRLPETDVQRPEGSPARVRLSALDVRRMSGLSPASSPDVRQKADMDGEESGAQSQNEEEARPAYVQPESGIEGSVSGIESGVPAEALPAGVSALIEHQAEEIAFLRSQLQQRDVAESEFRRLLLSQNGEIGRLQERVQLLLAAPPVEREDMPNTVTDELATMVAKNSPENSSIGALNSSVSDQEATPVTPSASHNPLQATDRQQSGKAAGDGQEVLQTQRRAWWKFWERGE